MCRRSCLCMMTPTDAIALGRKEGASWCGYATRGGGWGCIVRSFVVVPSCAVPMALPGVWLCDVVCDHTRSRTRMCVVRQVPSESKATNRLCMQSVSFADQHANAPSPPHASVYVRPCRDTLYSEVVPPAMHAHGGSPRSRMTEHTTRREHVSTH